MLDKYLQEDSGLEKELPGYIIYSLRQKIPGRFWKAQYTLAHWLKSTILFIFNFIQGLVCTHLSMSPVQGHWRWRAAPLCTPGACSSQAAPYSTFWPEGVSAGHLNTPHKRPPCSAPRGSPLPQLAAGSPLPGPLEAPFAQGSLAGNPTAREHEEQIRAGNTTPQIKPLSERMIETCQSICPALPIKI